MSVNTLEFLGQDGSNCGSITFTNTPIIIPRKGEIIKYIEPVSGDPIYMIVKEIIYNFSNETNQIRVTVLIDRLDLSRSPDA